LWCSWRITRDLPDGRAQVGDRHLKIYESRDNLPDGVFRFPINLSGAIREDVPSSVELRWRPW